MTYNALVYYVDGNFSIVENKDADVNGSTIKKFLFKYLATPLDEYAGFAFLDKQDKFIINDKEYMLIQNNGYLGEYEILNKDVSKFMKENCYWNCAIIRIYNGYSEGKDTEIGYMKDDEIATILNMMNDEKTH